VDHGEPDPADVTGAGKGLMDNPLVAMFFGAATAFGGGSLGARVPPKAPAPEPMTGRQQALLAVALYGPLFVVPVVVWLVTRNWILTAVWSGLIAVALFFVAMLIGGAMAYMGSRRRAP
jgi:hypothetical protein